MKIYLSLFNHIRSIMVVSRSLPHKSVCTSPRRLKNLSGNTEVSGTVRYCLDIRVKLGNSCWWCFQHIRGLCRWSPVLYVRLKLDFPFDTGPFLLHYINEVLRLVSLWHLKYVDTVPYHTTRISHLWSLYRVLTRTLSTHGLELLFHTFPTHIIRGSPDLFAFDTL